MEQKSFRIGQRVRIRDWDDMLKEFGPTRFGSIDCKYAFSSFMKHLCGCEAIICGIYGSEVKLCDWTGCEEGADTDFYYSFDMIEPVDSPATYEFDNAAFNAMLGITTEGGLYA